MKKFVVIPFRFAALAVLGLAAAVAHAQPMVNARVLSTQPVVEQVPSPGCGPYGAPTTGAGAAVGAVTGGLIGSQLGRGDGHIAGAILGALGGAMLGNAAEASQPNQGGCAPRYSQRVTGYDVVYEYGGRQYYTRMAQAPGQWLQIPAPDADNDLPAYANPEPDYGSPGDAQSYPVQPPPEAAYPAPTYPGAGQPGAVVTAPPAAAYPQATYPQPTYYPQQPTYYPQPGYPNAYPQAAYPAYPAPVYMQPAPRYVMPPVGVNLSLGGMIGRRAGVGVGVGF
jgi:uncharacterized protein YcfJ